MKKELLRKQFLQKRKALSLFEQETMSIAIANSCLRLPIWNLNNFHLFLPIEKKAEVETSFILTLLQGRDKMIVLPKVVDKQYMKAILLTDATKIKINAWGIPEPEGGIELTPDWVEVIFVPLLCVDKKGHRVGYGNGYYDRYLKQCKKGTIKIGLCFFEPIEEIEDINSNDIPLDYCISPKAIHFFSH